MKTNTTEITATEAEHMILLASSIRHDAMHLHEQMDAIADTIAKANGVSGINCLGDGSEAGIRTRGYIVQPMNDLSGVCDGLLDLIEWLHGQNADLTLEPFQLSSSPESNLRITDSDDSAFVDVQIPTGPPDEPDHFSARWPREYTPALVKPGMIVWTNLDCTPYYGTVVAVHQAGCTIKLETGRLVALDWRQVNVAGAQPDPAHLTP